MSGYSLFAWGFALASLVLQTQAAPHPAPRALAILSKRANTLLNCNAIQTAKVNQALADMANLANWGYQNAATNNIGYSHYFQAKELSVFKEAMSTIAANNDPTNAAYNFVVDCDPSVDIKAECESSASESYAITDGRVPANDNDVKTISLCPLFWNGPDTQNNLPDTNDQDALNAWCKQRSYLKFVTAGHVLLHEITHLDAVAKEFGIDPDPKTGEHGTIDTDSFSGPPMQSARRLKMAVDADPNTIKFIPPVENAESYAAAATEIWAMKFCKKQFIPPKVGFA